MRTNLSYGTGANQKVIYDAEAQIADNVGNSVSRDVLPDVVELGGWLVRDGKNVAASYDRYVGTMETRAPRTAVGLLSNGHLLFLVADGRQGESGVGLTGKELADLLMSFGAIEAAMLDGGGNSQMIVAGQIVNNPSTGRERPMAFAFVLLDRE
jgi:exopolysaccharide biosynthesis protein